MIKQGEVYWINLDPTIGTEIKKTRLCLIVSPNDIIRRMPRVIIAPLTSKGAKAGCRPIVNVNDQTSKILLDQIRSVDKRRLQKKIGTIALPIWQPILIEMLS